MSGAGVVFEWVFEVVKLFRCLDSSDWLMMEELSKWSKRDVILFSINSKCTKLPKTKNKNKGNNPTGLFAYVPPYTKNAKNKIVLGDIGGVGGCYKMGMGWGWDLKEEGEKGGHVPLSSRM